MILYLRIQEKSFIIWVSTATFELLLHFLHFFFTFLFDFVFQFIFLNFNCLHLLYWLLTRWNKLLKFLNSPIMQLSTDDLLETWIPEQHIIILNFSFAQ